MLKLVSSAGTDRITTLLTLLVAPFAQTTIIVIDQVPAVAVRTVYATSHITVFGCPAWEENCPVRNGETQAVVTATIGATTTVCPLTLSQARLSVQQGFSENTGGPLRTTTTRWPTIYSLPSTFEVTQTSWDPAIWASIFPSGAPAFTDPVSTGTFADGEWTGTPSPLPTLSPEQEAILGFSGSNNDASSGGSVNGSSGASGSSGESVTVTTGSFAAIFSSNMTSYITTLNAFTNNYTTEAAVPTGGSNGTLPGGFAGSPTTTRSNGTVVGTGPVTLQTVNVSPVVPVNLFSLLVALAGLAFAV